MRRTGLQRGPSQEVSYSATGDIEIRCSITILPMHSCLSKLQNLRSAAGNSSTLVRRARMIVTVIAMTPTHPEVIGMAVLWNLFLLVRSLHGIRKVSPLTSV
jgi:hypothetical protein